MSRLPGVAEVFAISSLLSFGGTNAVVPYLRREIVDHRSWSSNIGFAEAYTLAQLVPGPSTTIVTVLGYQAAGVAGAALATVAMILPSCALAFLFARLWRATGTAHWHKVLEKGLGPVGIGLIGSAGVMLARAADHNALAWLMTGCSCAVLTLTDVSPLFVIGAGGVLGLMAF